MNPHAQVNEALAMREDAILKFKREIVAKAHYFDMHGSITTDQNEASLDVWTKEALRLCYETLRRAETFAWSENITKAVTSAANKLPRDVPFHRAWLPVKCGWWWFGLNSPLIVPCETGRTTGIIDESRPLPPPWRHICAITYHVIGNENSVFFEALTLDHNESRGPTGILAATWKEGESHRTFMKRQRDIRLDSNIWWNQACDILSKFLMSGSLWLQQKVALVSDRQQGGERHVRKRLEKADVNTGVRIVHLRKTEQKDVQNPGSGKPLEWRIHVAGTTGGFWRNQYYPSTGAHVPIWVEDYYRGPEDAPLKAPSKVIYAVTR